MNSKEKPTRGQTVLAFNELGVPSLTNAATLQIIGGEIRKEVQRIFKKHEAMVVKTSTDPLDLFRVAVLGITGAMEGSKYLDISNRTVVNTTMAILAEAACDAIESYQTAFHKANPDLPA